MKKLFLLVLTASMGCGSDDSGENSTLNVAWTFESGDCAANKIEKVRATMTPQGGTATTKEFACALGKGDMGTISKTTYAITGEATDASGKVRFTSTQSASFPDGKIFGSLDMRLRAKASNVTVTWNGCPGSTILPYTISIYRGTSKDKVSDVQESCQSKRAVLKDIDPGSYTVEVDSRAISPKVLGTQPVTVVAGDDVEVNVPVP